MIDAEKWKSLTAEEAARYAVEADREIRALKERIKMLESDRDTLTGLAFNQGIQQFDGYRFTRPKAAVTVTFEAVVDYDEAHGTTHADDYIAWFRRTAKVSTSAASFRRYLDENGVADADTVMEGCSVTDDRDTPTYRLTAPKGAVL